MSKHSTSGAHTTTSSGEALLLTLPEVAQLLGVSRSSLYKLLKADELKKIKILGSTRVARSEVERLLRRLGA